MVVFSCLLFFLICFPYFTFFSIFFYINPASRALCGSAETPLVTGPARKKKTCRAVPMTLVGTLQEACLLPPARRMRLEPLKFFAMFSNISSANSFPAKWRRGDIDLWNCRYGDNDDTTSATVCGPRQDVSTKLRSSPNSRVWLSDVFVGMLSYLGWARVQCCVWPHRFGQHFL